MPAGVAAAGRSGSLVRSSSQSQEQQPSEEAAVINRSVCCSRSSSRQQELQLSAGTAEAEVVEAVASSATVAVLERRAGARAQTLARGRGSEASLRSPEPAMPELEISWEQEEEECGRREAETGSWSPPCQSQMKRSGSKSISCPVPSQQGFTCSCCLSRNHTAYPFCVCCGYKFLY